VCIIMVKHRVKVRRSTHHKVDKICHCNLTLPCLTLPYLTLLMQRELHVTAAIHMTLLLYLDMPYITLSIGGLSSAVSPKLAPLSFQERLELLATFSSLWSNFCSSTRSSTSAFSSKVHTPNLDFRPHPYSSPLSSRSSSRITDAASNTLLHQGC